MKTTATAIAILIVMFVNACGPENPNPVEADGSVLADTSIKPDTAIKSDSSKLKPDGTTTKPDGTTTKPDGTTTKPDSGSTFTLLPGTLVPHGKIIMKGGSSMDLCGQLFRIHSSGAMIEIECNYLKLEKTATAPSVEIGKGKAGYPTALLAKTSKSGLSIVRVRFTKASPNLIMNLEVDVSQTLAPGTLVKHSKMIMKGGATIDMCGKLYRIHSSGSMIPVECNYLKLEKTATAPSVDIGKGKAGYTTALLAKTSKSGLSIVRVRFTKASPNLIMNLEVDVQNPSKP